MKKHIKNLTAIKQESTRAVDTFLNTEMELQKQNDKLQELQKELQEEINKIEELMDEAYDRYHTNTGMLERIGKILRGE
jgi:hypothetical protein